MATPAPPQPPYFDAALDVWILSRYADVLAAFRHPQLWTIAVTGKDQMEVRDETGRLAARGQMQEALSHTRVAEWQGGFQAEVERVLASLPADRPVDLLSEFAQPCCLWLAALVTSVEPADIAQMGAWGAAAFGGTGAAAGSTARLEAEEATAALNRYFESAAFRMGEPTFVGISQTTARLLANGWLTLLRHRAEWQRLREQPELMASAIEELLRFAGIVPTLFRRAYGEVEIGGARIATGQQVHLKIASANRDPEQFPDPERLDIARHAVTHLSLGIGRNSCVGNLIIRMAYTATLSALVRFYPEARIEGAVEWAMSPSFCWPHAVPVRLR